MRLFGYWRSSASWRVRWAFQLKGVNYAYVPVNILKGENKQPEHLQRNPLGAVPVLELEKGVYLSESLAIMEWAEEVHTGAGPSLYPGSAFDRAHIRSLCEIINSGTAPLQTPRAQNRHSGVADEKTAWALHFTRQGLDAFEKISRPSRGTFSFKDDVTAADICLVPQIYNAQRFGIDVKAEFPDLHAIYQRGLRTEACQKASPERQIDAVISP